MAWGADTMAEVDAKAATPDQQAMGLGPQGRYTEQVLWPGSGVVWFGQSANGYFVVEDIVDNGRSERAITGRKPNLMPIPVTQIEARGGHLAVATDHAGPVTSPQP